MKRCPECGYIGSAAYMAKHLAEHSHYHEESIGFGDPEPDVRYLITKRGLFYHAEAISRSHPNGPDGPRDGIDYEMAPAEPTQADLVEQVALSRAEMKALWIKHGGKQVGPIVEQYYIEEQAWYRFARELAVAAIATPDRLGLERTIKHWIDQSIALGTDVVVLRTEIAAKDAEIARLRAVAIECAVQFEFYEREHLRKGTPDGDAKAYRNKQFADKCRAAAVPGEAVAK